jgi:hypothetical protein
MKNMFTFNGIQEALSGTLPGNAGQFFNPFADELTAGPNSAFQKNKNLIGSISEDIRSDIMQFHTVLGGTLYDLPSGAVTVAGGFEYRSEDYIVNEDPNSKAGNSVPGHGKSNQCSPIYLEHFRGSGYPHRGWRLVLAGSSFSPVDHLGTPGLLGRL